MDKPQLIEMVCNCFDNFIVMIMEDSLGQTL